MSVTARAEEQQSSPGATASRQQLDDLAAEIKRRRMHRDGSRRPSEVSVQGAAEPAAFVFVDATVSHVAKVYGQFSRREVLVSGRVQNIKVTASARDLTALEASVVIEKLLRDAGVKVVPIDLYTVALIPLAADAK